MSTSLSFGGEVVQGELEIVVTRANGDTENKGIVSYYNANPLLQAKWEIEVLGQITEETTSRLKKTFLRKLPYIGVVSLAVISLILKRGR